MSIKGQPLKRGAACEGEPRQPLRRCGGQLPPSHRPSSLSCAGVAHGLFSDSAPTHLRCAGVPLGLFGKPKRSSFSRFAPSIKPYYALFSKTHMLQVRCANPTGTGEPRHPLRRCAPAPPFAPKCPFGTFRCSGRLISTKSTQYSLLQNARPSGSLREPYGYRGAKAAHRAALLREKRPRRRLLRGRWKRGIGIFTASGGCRPVRCGRR